MDKINFTEPQTPEWQDWKNDCEIEQNKLNESMNRGDRIITKAELYKRQKHIYFDRHGDFRGKCAYCEKFIFTDQFGDIDHFRPKAAIKNKDGSDVMIIVNNQEVKHEGYYWLTYDWKNLLPSCILCNRPSKHHSNGLLSGKSSQFPVKNFRATRPTEENQEEPLLINPVFDNPEEHISVDSTGVIFSIENNEKGNTTIDVIGLNERDLPSLRKAKYDDTILKMRALLTSLISDPNGEFTKKILNDISNIKNGNDEFTLIAKKAIKDSEERTMIGFGLI